MSKITVTTIAGQTSGSDANKVKIESGDTLEVTSNATVGGTLGVTGDATFDTSVLKVDASNNRVGVGTASPTSDLHVSGGSGANVAIQSSAGSHWRLGDAVGSSNGYFIVRDHTNSANRITIRDNGAVGIGAATPDAQLDVRKDNPGSGRLAIFGSNGTPNTGTVVGVGNAITIGRSLVTVAPNTTTNLIQGYGGSMVLLTLIGDSGVADIQRTVLISHAWSAALVLFSNNYGGNSPTFTYSASSGVLRVNHNHSGNIKFNVAGLIISGPNNG